MQGVDDPLGVTEQDTCKIRSIRGLTGKNIPGAFRVRRCSIVVGQLY